MERNDTEEEAEKHFELHGYENQALETMASDNDGKDCINNLHGNLPTDLSTKVEDGENDEAKVETDQIIADTFFEDLQFEPNWITNLEDKVREAKAKLVKSLEETCPNLTSTLPYLILLLLYNVFFFGAIYHHNITEGARMEWCDGLGFLVIITLMFYVLYSYFKFVKPTTSDFLDSRAGVSLRRNLITPIETVYQRIITNRFSTLAAAGLLFTVVFIVVIIDTADNRERLVSAFGILVLVFTGFVFSKHPGRVVWRHVIWGLALQFVFAIVILRSETGRSIFQCLGDKFTNFLGYTDQGSAFVYGPLVSQQPFITTGLNKTGLAYQIAVEINEAKAFSLIFMFKVLSVIYFVSFFISMLFYLGWMQWFVIKMGWILQVTIGTTACESMNTAANVFLGYVEAPLMIKPYMHLMTNSELHAVMTGGFATIAGSVLAAYISFGISASHLLSASVMSAPAALAMAKLMYPETKKSKTLPEDIVVIKGQEANLLDAASQGAVTAVYLVANISANLISVLAFVGFLNGVLSWCGNLVGVEGLTFELILGKMFIPLAWIMGVPNQDLDKVGILLGLKTFASEFLAYEKLGHYGDSISPRSRVISTYALCGFSNPASIGIQLAALSTMAPSRRSDLARVAFRAFVAGSMACFMTACVAGMLIDEE